MGHYGLKLEEAIQGLAEAVASHTPEKIQATGIALREQIQLTEAEEEKVRAARSMIDQAAHVQTLIGIARREVEEQKAELEGRAGEADARDRATDERIIALNNREKALGEQDGNRIAEDKRLKDAAKAQEDKEVELLEKSEGLKTEEKRLKAWDKRLRDATGG